MKNYFMFMICATLLSACTVKTTPAKVEIEGPGVKYKHHCPPGHAKKGWC